MKANLIKNLSLGLALLAASILLAPAAFAQSNAADSVDGPNIVTVPLSYGVWNFGSWYSSAGDALVDETFTYTGAGCLWVTDAYVPGDEFHAIDNGEIIGATSEAANIGGPWTNDPDVAFPDPTWSSGAFAIGNGSHSFRIQVTDNPWSPPGSVYVKVDDCAGDAARATFMVTKDFDDGNPAGVDVTLSCNTGLPLEQTKTIAEGGTGVEFVVTDFDSEQLDCTVTEDVPSGYVAEYYDGTVSSVSCDYENVPAGGQRVCEITNKLQQVEIEVTKIWIDDHPEFQNSTYARARWFCDDEYYVILLEDATDSAEGFGGCYGYDDCGSLNFYGMEDSQSFSVYPHYNGTYCHVSEKIYDSGVESDTYDCSHVVVYPGSVDTECTIYNTRFYEGIPTLSQYGLAIMALLMLAVGFVGFRRFI